MLSVDLVEKKYFSYVSSWSQTNQHSQKRGFYNTTKMVIGPLPTEGKLVIAFSKAAPAFFIKWSGGYFLK